MPSLARASGGSRVTSSPSNFTVPEVGTRSPVRQLKKVDLPAPLGPIRPTISPSATDTEAVSTALKAPKAMTMSLASSSIAISACRALLEERCQQADKARRQEAGDNHDDGAVNDERKAGAAAA